MFFNTIIHHIPQLRQPAELYFYTKIAPATDIWQAQANIRFRNTPIKNGKLFANHLFDPNTHFLDSLTNRVGDISMSRRGNLCSTAVFMTVGRPNNQSTAP